MGSIFFLAPIFLAGVLQKIILTTSLEVTVDRAEGHLLNFLIPKGVGNSLPDTTTVIAVPKVVALFGEQHRSAGSIRCNHSRAALLTHTLFAGSV